MVSRRDSPFGDRLFGARPEWFWCDIVAKAIQNFTAIAD